MGIVDLGDEKTTMNGLNTGKEFNAAVFYSIFSKKGYHHHENVLKKDQLWVNFKTFQCLYRLKFAYFICIGETKAELASHVLQFVFLGNTGFRFPFAHWPTKEVDPSTLYIIFWKAVFWLLKAAFKVRYCCCDGGEANRSFIKLHFKDKDPFKELFTITNPYTKEPLYFILDFAVSYLLYIIR